MPVERSKLRYLLIHSASPNWRYMRQSQLSFRMLRASQCCRLQYCCRKQSSRPHHPVHLVPQAHPYIGIQLELDSMWDQPTSMPELRHHRIVWLTAAYTYLRSHLHTDHFQMPDCCRWPIQRPSNSNPLPSENLSAFRYLGDQE